MKSILKNLKIIEVASVLAGPAVGSFFAELGASVLKIENKNIGGDVTRKWRLAGENPNNPISAYYAAANYGKTVLQLDLNNQDDKKTLEKELASADIVISNYKKGSAEHFGLDYEHLKKKNPKIIYASITGYGENSTKAAYDVVLQAESGMMSMNGDSKSGPIKMPIAFIDIFAAHQLKEGILLALLQRSISGKGAKVTVSLYDAALASLANQATNYLMNNVVAERMGSLHPNIAPYGEIFETKDRKSIVLAVGNDKQFIRLCKLLKIEQYVGDKKFIDNLSRVINRKILYQILQKAFKKQNADEWNKLLEEAQIPAGIIKNLKQVFENQEAKNLILTEEIEGQKSKRIATAIFKIQSN